MSIKEPFIAELQNEGKVTRKLLERVPLDNPAWKPHEKSMALGRLAAHVAELPSWITMTLTTEELDFAKSKYKPLVLNSAEELTALHDKNIAAAVETLNKQSDEDFMKNWSMRSGETIFFTMPKIQVLRGAVYNHLIHHRAQLGVYLRLLNEPLPQMYGPTADEPMNF